MKNTLNYRVKRINRYFPDESADLNSAGFRRDSVCQSVIVRDVLQPATESMYPLTSNYLGHLSGVCFGVQNGSYGIQGMMKIRAPITIAGRTRLFAVPLVFFCLFSSLLIAQPLRSDMAEAATAGKAPAQFALANELFVSRYQTLDYANLVGWYRRPRSLRIPNWAGDCP
jgi:hypothetical protein